MPKAHLPVFAKGLIYINPSLSYEKQDGNITYFNGMMPVFTHDENDLNTFRMITSQFYINGNVTQSEICQTFGLPAITVKRAVKKYREEGVSGFYKPRKTRVGGTILTTEILGKAQELLNQHKEVTEIAGILDIKRNTLNKAVLDKRLHKPEKKMMKMLTP